MSNISPEQKLELVRSIRMQNQHNRNQCRERERFLYGYTTSSLSSEHENSQKQPDSSVFKGFRIRFCIAISIIGLFIFFDKSQTFPFPISTDEIATYLSSTSEIKETFNSFDL